MSKPFVFCYAQWSYSEFQLGFNIEIYDDYYIQPPLLRDFTRSYGKTSYRLVDKSPGYLHCEEQPCKVILFPHASYGCYFKIVAAQ